MEENERVQSYLLIPDNRKSKNPAILAIHQHASNWEVGKSEVVGLTKNPMFSYGLDLVKRGYVVIAPDILCFESRIGKVKYKEGKEANMLYERFQFCKYMLNGSTLQGKTLSDLSAAIDVLVTLDYVDKDNIGVIGHSLGGQEAVWMQWFDKRLKAGVSSCGVSTFKAIMDNVGLQNFYLYLPGILEKCDVDEVIYEITRDRKLLITSGLKDDRHCPLDGVKTIEQRVTNGNLISIKFHDGHKFNDAEKETAYKFFDDNLKHN